jgi:hypothetical protein
MPHDDAPEVLGAIPDGQPYGKSRNNLNQVKVRNDI